MGFPNTCFAKKNRAKFRAPGRQHGRARARAALPGKKRFRTQLGWGNPSCREYLRSQRPELERVFTFPTTRVAESIYVPNDPSCREYLRSLRPELERVFTLPTTRVAESIYAPTDPSCRAHLRSPRPELERVF